MSIKIYLAAPWKRKEEAKAVKQQLEQEGWTITSRWISLEGTYEKDGFKTKEEYFAAQAVNDVNDVVSADFLVMLNLEYSEGKMFELGLALALQKPAIIVGERTHVFHYLPIPVMSDVPAAIALIKQWIKEAEDYMKKAQERISEETAQT